jgi:cysteine/O-acetylserine efflux protein
MMTSNLLALISFVLISTFTPGPSNISSASMAILYGYRNTLRFLAGLTSGVFVMMLLGGLVSSTLLNLFPAVEPVLRIMGAGYLVYLAIVILKASYTFEQAEANPMGYAQGLLVNLLNPKLVVYAFTLFTAFLTPIVDNIALVIVAAALLALTAFSAATVWALFGTAIRRYLRQPRITLVINLIFSLFLVYTAADIAGII